MIESHFWLLANPELVTYNTSKWGTSFFLCYDRVSNKPTPTILNLIIRIFGWNDKILQFFLNKLVSKTQVATIAEMIVYLNLAYFQCWNLNDKLLL